MTEDRKRNLELVQQYLARENSKSEIIATVQEPKTIIKVKKSDIISIDIEND